ncbi:hypothetical protein [Jannaschia pohangensis]|uniref:Uncharacterized protein n=1 Tax=Jannaschia pohangensis TaxID=390807 RepID=A0A1I3MF62_9RHOB|nr:hypothetical protein [Jannaschia pohangensis]SFI95355.1 hypothetical protein SAMN04488095_1820 [Jannaschia pohangensis]
MIRPEAKARLLRWREALIGASCAVAGLWLWLATAGLPALFGAVAMAIGAVLILSGMRRARFRSTHQDPGIVRIVEGRISYMGPVTGGSVALDDLVAVTLLRDDTGAAWCLTPEAERDLVIPEGAIGAEGLLDALAPLPGLDSGAMVRAVQSRTGASITVWRREQFRALT